jgi:hypothetical protein
MVVSPEKLLSYMHDKFRACRTEKSAAVGIKVRGPKETVPVADARDRQ